MGLFKPLGVAPSPDPQSPALLHAEPGALLCPAGTQHSSETLWPGEVGPPVESAPTQRGKNLLPCSRPVCPHVGQHSAPCPSASCFTVATPDAPEVTKPHCPRSPHPNEGLSFHASGMDVFEKMISCGLCRRNFFSLSLFTVPIHSSGSQDGGSQP